MTIKSVTVGNSVPMVIVRGPYLVLNTDRGVIPVNALRM
jgi:hypothetical protein